MGNEAEVEEITEEVVEEVTEVVDEVESPEVAEGEVEEQPDWLKPEGDSVPLATLLKTKGKLKGQIADRDTENELLKEKIKNLESSIQTPSDSSPLKRPRERDFDTDEDYDTAMDDYEAKKDERNFNRATQHNTQQSQQEQFKQRIDQGLDAHYERKDKFLLQNSIAPAVYDMAETNIIQTIESIAPGSGAVIAAELFTELGEGSEQVMMYVGNNKDRLEEFKNSLIGGQRGLKAAVILGRAQEAVKLNKKRTSQAPKPASSVGGNSNVSGSAKETALKKKYDDAHKKNDIQAVFKYKKEAKAAGVDTKKW